MLKKKKKIDQEALQSAFMRIPKMKVEAARSLINTGLSEIYELQGRSPESLFSELKQKNPDAPKEHLAYFRLAVYYAENDPPEKDKLDVYYWID